MSTFTTTRTNKVHPVVALVAAVLAPIAALASAAGLGNSATQGIGGMLALLLVAIPPTLAGIASAQRHQHPAIVALWVVGALVLQAIVAAVAVFALLYAACHNGGCFD